MNVVPLPNGKFKHEKKYKCPFTNKWRKVSVNMKTSSTQSRNQAEKLLQIKIREKTTRKSEKFYKIETIVNEFLEEKRLSVCSSTLERAKSCAREFLRYLPRTTYISDINANMVQKFINFKLERCSFSCAKNYFSFIRQLLNFATRWGYIEDGAFINKVSLKKPPKTVGDIKRINEKLLDRKELKEVLEKVKAIHPQCGLILEFQSLTGLRINELLALRVQDYNGSAVEVNATYDKSGRRNPPKNVYSFRTVHLSKRAQEIIEYFIERAEIIYQTNKKVEDFIFITSTGLPYDYRFINRKLKEIDHPKHITTHAFRHTHISLLAEQGVPVRAIMQRVGHNEMRTTISIYTHVTEKMSEELAEALEKI